MPTEKTVWNWVRSQPEFARLRTQALAQARTAAVAARAARDRAPRGYGGGVYGVKAPGYGPTIWPRD